MLSHERSVTRIGRYLLDTANIGLMCKVDKGKDLECCVDADFAGGWSQECQLNLDNVFSRNRFVIIYSGTPIF